MIDTVIRGEDWYARDLVKDEYTQVAFLDVDMTELSSTGAVFTDCTFTNVRFNVSKHTESAFVNCTFSRCNFFDASFIRCKLTGSVFDGCSFDLMDVDGGNWSFVGLTSAKLSGTTFHGVRLR